MSRAPAAVLVLACLLAAALAALAPPAAANPERPNVVVIETDDQTAADLASMPHTRRLIGGRGVEFEQSVVSLSQCCPSRATFLTGRYAHNHGVLSAQPPFGAFEAFDASESLAVWLERAGYATALAGKYMNGYGRDDPAHVPPGWTEWHGLLGPSTYSYYGFAINHGGRVRRYGAAEYQTDVLTGIAEDVIRRRAGGDRPFFLWQTYVAPHVGYPNPLDGGLEAPVPSPLSAGELIGPLRPHTPAFDEADVSDKPAAIRRRPRLGPRMRERVDRLWRRRQASLRSVDAGVRRIVAALDRAGVLEDTLLVFTSDNGYLTGEHRVTSGKVLPYEPSIRVPLLVRGPGVPEGEVRSQLVWNGDLAPTILEATGARAPWAADGQSLWPVVRDRRAPSSRAVLLEGPPAGRTDPAPRFTGLRTPEHLYVEHLSGERELYDLRRDPHELSNLAATPAAAGTEAALARRLDRLRGCAGAQCAASP